MLTVLFKILVEKLDGSRCGDCGNNITLRKSMEYSSKGGNGVCLKL